MMPACLNSASEATSVVASAPVCEAAAREPAGVRPLLTAINGLLAATQGGSGWVYLLGGVFGYVLVAFLVAFGNAALLALLTGVRLRAVLPTYHLEPDHAWEWLWRLIPAGQPVFHTCRAQPRAPPV